MQQVQGQHSAHREFTLHLPRQQISAITLLSMHLLRAQQADIPRHIVGVLPLLHHIQAIPITTIFM